MNDTELMKLMCDNFYMCFSQNNNILTIKNHKIDILTYQSIQLKKNKIIPSKNKIISTKTKTIPTKTKNKSNITKNKKIIKLPKINNSTI